MKKLIFGLLVMLCITVNAQQSEPFVGAGASISEGMPTYGLELGFYNDKLALAIGDEVYEMNGEYNNMISFRTYIPVYTVNKVCFNYFSACKMHTNSDLDLVFEQGFAVGFNISDHINPYFNFTTYFGEGDSLFNPTRLAIGISLWLI
jgi:hypothetical protein